jgi:hypothetical protein
MAGSGAFGVGGWRRDVMCPTTTRATAIIGALRLVGRCVNMAGYHEEKTTPLHSLNLETMEPSGLPVAVSPLAQYPAIPAALPPPAPPSGEAPHLKCLCSARAPKDGKGT